MKNCLKLIPLAIILIVAHSSCKDTGDSYENRTTLFDDNWCFIKADPEGAEKADFNDSEWRQIDLPHDWSIEDLPDQSDSVKGPFTKASPHKMRTGYTLGGTAWYRKTFTINKTDAEKIAYLQFDGVYMNSDVWVNGKHVGNHPYGYTSFYYDITSFLNPAGEPNVVAVQVRNEGANARWYSGSGIYRHTWLTLVDPVHLEMWGVFVKTPSVNKKNAEIEVSSTIVNSADESASVKLKVDIIDPYGGVVGTLDADANVSAQSKEAVEKSISIENPRLWSVDDPNLYTASVSVMKNGKTVDVKDIKFGIRTLEFSADNGFLLNDEPIELVGGCFHHDNGPLGAKAIDRAEERKMELFKKAGLNAIRTSHNPPSPYLLDVCDRLGILVIDEIFDNWEEPKVSDEDYSRFFKEWWKKDLESMIRRDWNHPSVILWSFGNEVHQSLDTIDGMRITKDMVSTIRSLDNSRGITVGYNDFAFRSGNFDRWYNAAPILELLDVVGYNYMYARYEGDHAKYPDRVMAGTEFGPLYSLENWKEVEDHSYVIGNFAWVIMDYIGEAGVGFSRLVPDAPAGQGAGMGAFFSRESWPVYTNFQGDIDLIGNFKPRYYHQLVVWRKSPVEMMVHEPVPAGMKEMVSQWGWPNELKCWNWEGHEGENLQVHVYTRSPKVTLELNGKKIGEQTVDGVESITATFEVPYEPGTLTARCYNASGDEVASETIKTVGKPAAIRLVADRPEIKADRNDLSYVMAEIVDSEGNLVPNADSIMVSFELTGNAEIAAVGSGSPVDMASFQQPKRRTWHGKCLAIVRPLGNDSGTLKLSAKSEGLKGSEVEIAQIRN